jgi:transcriptional regulator with XRE-family HTH domain
MAPLPSTKGIGGVLAVQRTGTALSKHEYFGMVQCLAAMMGYCRVHHSELPSQPDTIVEGLGKTMRAVRREMGFSLKQVAERMACKPQHVSGWERVTLKLSIPELFKWAECLGLLAWEDKPIIQVRTLNQAVLKMVKKNPEQIKSLTSEQFELLVAERLDKAGYRVELTGDVNQKDGGIDLIAVPKTGMVPYMIAVQAKHHYTDRKTGRPAVDRLLSWRERFDVGLLVTNTSFTADACFAAMRGNQERAPFVRLRDMNDLKRWLMNDFTSTQDWREMPTSVELAPGVMIEVPRPVLSEVRKIWPFKKEDLKGFT